MKRLQMLLALLALHLIFPRVMRGIWRLEITRPDVSPKRRSKRRFDSAKEEFKALEIAHALGMSRRGVQRRAEREQWPFQVRPALGGQTRFYAFATLPRGVQKALLRADGSAE